MHARPPNESRTGRLAALGSATVFSACAAAFSLPSRIRQLSGGRVAGTALTVTLPPGDNLHLHQAIAAADAGSVLVAGIAERQPGGYFGDVMATACRAKRINGLVIDGTVRDLDELRHDNFPVYATGTAFADTGKRGAAGFGLTGSVTLDDCTVRDGDYLLADATGVVVVPAAVIDRALDAAEQRARNEDEIIRALECGRSTIEVLGL